MMDTRANEGRWSVALTYTAERTNIINDGFGVGCTSAVGRKRVLANGGLLEVHLGTSQQAVVDFMFAAIGVIEVLAVVVVSKQ